jgi:hypothetical protein
MTEHDIDDLFRRAADRSRSSFTTDPAEVLSSIGPRLTRARLAHRARVGAGVCATLLVVGFGVMSIRPQGPEPDTSFANPEPTLEPTPTLEEVADDAPQIDPEVGVPSDLELPTPTDGAVVESDDSPSDDDATPTAKPAPSATSTPVGTTVSKQSPAGTITVVYDDSGIVYPVQFEDSSWTVTWKTDGAHKAEAKVSKGDNSFELSISFDHGEPKIEVDDEHADGH